MRSSNPKGKCELTLRGHKSCIYCCAVLPDKRIISGSEYGILKVWNIETGRLRSSNPKGQCELSFRAHTGLISCCAVLPDRRIITGSSNGTLKVCNISENHLYDNTNLLS
jgi:WD40 repeat protein